MFYKKTSNPQRNTKKTPLVVEETHSLNSTEHTSVCTAIAYTRLHTVNNNLNKQQGQL
jgi:hypothetical protein